MLNFNECLEAVCVKSHPEYLPKMYEEMVADGSADSTRIVSEDYIREVSDRYNLFENTLDLVIESGRAIAKNQALLRYVNMMARVYADRPFLKAKGGMPIAWKGEPDIAFDFAAMIALLPAMEHAEKVIREHGLPEHMAKRNFRSFEGCINIHVKRFDWPALNATYFNWLQHYIDINIIDFGGFNFEMIKSYPAYIAMLKNRSTGEVAVLPFNKVMHRDGMILGSAGFEDEEGSYTAEFIENDSEYIGYPCLKNGFCSGVRTVYPKSEWEYVFGKGDNALSVHIPRGTKLSGSSFTDAYTGAIELLKGYFPEFNAKAVVCHSWLMDTRIDEICGGAPNIMNFQSPFNAFPLMSAGKEVFSFVFTRPFKSLEDLPEDTRLMRALKQRYIDGGFIHAFGGVFLP